MLMWERPQVDNYHPNLRLPSTLQRLTVSSSSFFSTSLFTLSALIVLFLAAADSCSRWKSFKTHSTLPAQQQTADRQIENN